MNSNLSLLDDFGVQLLLFDEKKENAVTHSESSTKAQCDQKVDLKLEKK